MTLISYGKHYHIIEVKIKVFRWYPVFRNKLYKAKIEDMDNREEYSIVAIAMATMLIGYSLLLLMFVVYCVKYSHQTITSKYDLESSNEFGHIMDWSEDNSRYSNKISCQDNKQYLKRDSIVSTI